MKDHAIERECMCHCCLLRVYEESLLIHSPDNYLFSISHEQAFAGEIDSSYFLRIWVEVCESQGADL